MLARKYWYHELGIDDLCVFGVERFFLFVACCVAWWRAFYIYTNRAGSSR